MACGAPECCGEGMLGEGALGTCVQGSPVVWWRLCHDYVYAGTCMCSMTCSVQYAFAVCHICKHVWCHAVCRTCVVCPACGV